MRSHRKSVGPQPERGGDHLWFLLFVTVTPAAVAFAVFGTYIARAPQPEGVKPGHEEAKLHGSELETQKTQFRETVKRSRAEVAEPKQTKGVASRVPGRALKIKEPAEIASGWGDLGPLAEYLGPDTKFQAFYKRLQRQIKKTDYDWRCPLYCIRHPTLYPVLHFNSTVTGEGKVGSELEVMPFSDHVSATLTFYASPMADLRRARENRNERILQVARALNLSRDEIRRLKAILQFLPIPSSRSEEAPRRALSEFLSNLPKRVQTEFLDTWQAWLAEEFSYETGGLPPGKVFARGCGPAIGFPLSERHIADIGFCLFDAMEFHDAEHYEFGPWWSIALWPRDDTSHTDPKHVVRAKDVTMKAWPRLTLTEVDSIAGMQEQ